VGGLIIQARRGSGRPGQPVQHRDGLAAYEENPRHRRAKLVRLTPPGRRVLGTIQAAQRIWADALGGEIGEGDLRQASIVLDRVLQVLMDRRPRGGSG
jgi:DNA-binding MarR family transcriptional regulator